MSHVTGEVMVEMKNPIHGDQQPPIAVGKDPEIQARQDAMDLVRGLACLLMVFQHTVMYFGCWDELVLGPLFKWTQNGPGSVAIYFMFILGINSGNEQRNGPWSMARRGIKVLLFGYFLTLIRDILPIAISCHFKDICSDDVFYDASNKEIMLSIDIFAFAGAAFLWFALMRALKVPKYAQLTFTAILVLVFALFEREAPDADPTGLLGYFILGEFYHNYFPFASWIIFPVLGSVWASHWRPIKGESVPMKYIFPVCCVVWVSLFLLMIFTFPRFDHYGWDNYMYYYKQPPLTNLFFLCQNVLLLEISYFLFKLNVVPKLVFRFLHFWSRQIMSLYVVSWCLITWVSLVVMDPFSIDHALLLYFIILCVVTVSHLMVAYIPIIPKGLKKLLR